MDPVFRFLALSENQGMLNLSSYSQGPQWHHFGGENSVPTLKVKVAVEVELAVDLARTAPTGVSPTDISQ